MKILYVLYTYNRPQILQACLQTLFNPKNILWPTEMIVVDDGSILELKDALYNFHRDTKKFPIHFFSFGANQGLGYNWELVFSWIMARNFDYFIQLEQDYIWRENAIAEAIEVLEKKPLSCCVSGYSNPDFYTDKREWLFRKVMIEDFGDDPAKREYLHKPFHIDTKFGKIEITLTTNSCGTFICNWRRVKQLLDKYPEMWVRCFERAFNKPYPERRKAAGDGPITSGISYYWYKDIEERIKNGEQINYENEAPWLDISDYSLSDHKNGGPSLNGHIIEEGLSFVSSPKWSDSFLNQNPRRT
ncbi:MAG: glycosyltransferase [Nanoarchaeota archaeon]